MESSQEVAGPDPGADAGNRTDEPAVTADIAVLIPCYNEAATIGRVVEEFSRTLDGARIIVGDNASSDASARIARDAGAEVIPVSRPGKGAVIRTLFRNVDADYYVMVDGDDTYPAERVHELLAPVFAGEADMVVGDRISGGEYSRENKRPFHSFGNSIVVGLINLLFRADLRDILSGYRAFNRRFVKNCPVLEDGFTLETIMTLHALDKLFTIREVPVAYRDRPAGSESKLSTVRDGLLVLRSILWIFKDNKPLWFFVVLSNVLFAASLAVAVGGVAPSPWVPALLCIAGLVFLVCGFVLDTLVKLQRESFEVNLMLQEQSPPDRPPS